LGEFCSVTSAGNGEQREKNFGELDKRGGGRGFADQLSG